MHPSKASALASLRIQTGIDSRGVRTRALDGKRTRTLSRFTHPNMAWTARKKPVDTFIEHGAIRVTDLSRIADDLRVNRRDVERNRRAALISRISVWKRIISTMGKCMEAAAGMLASGCFYRPNPLGAACAWEGPLVEPRWVSFVSQFRCPTCTA